MAIDLLAAVEDAAGQMAQAHAQLWKGEWASIRWLRGKQVYPSQSEADLALASHIARYLVGMGVPKLSLPSLVERVFERSALSQRPKWHSRPDYRASTIGMACATATTSSQAPPQPFPAVDWSVPGDVRNAAFFSSMFEGQLAFVPERKQWMRWASSRWAMCGAGEEMEYAKRACAALYADAGAQMAKDPVAGQGFAREAAQAHLLARIRAMLELAQSDPRVSVPGRQLDADAHVLGVGNGIVSLRKGELQANTPAKYITRHCTADFDPHADCPRWLEFLNEVFEGDRDTIGVVHRLLGYTLTGLSTEEIMVFCVGFGANGKSLFGNVVAEIMGEYAKVAPPSLLAARRGDDHGPRADLAMLEGARLVSINELPAGLQLDEQVVKQLAGREPISARHLYGEFFTFRPSFTAWVRTNHKPIIKGDDDGIWRRIVILPFRRKFAAHEQDPQLESKLLAERDGILSWMVEGAKLYLQSGLSLSPSMKVEQAQYRKDSDLLGEFLEECTTPGINDRVEQCRLYNIWSQWCQSNGSQPGTKKTFTQRLAERGFRATQSNGKRYYVGLACGLGAGLPFTGREGRD